MQAELVEGIGQYLEADFPFYEVSIKPYKDSA